MTDDKVAHRAAVAKYAASDKGKVTRKRRRDRRNGAPFRSYFVDDTTPHASQLSTVHEHTPWSGPARVRRSGALT